MQVMTESLQDAKIDFNQLELTDTLGEGASRVWDVCEMCVDVKLVQMCQ